MMSSKLPHPVVARADRDLGALVAELAVNHTAAEVILVLGGGLDTLKRARRPTKKSVPGTDGHLCTGKEPEYSQAGIGSSARVSTR